MQKWLIPANGNKYDHESSFKKNGFIDWNQNYNYEINDIVYIYCSSPIQRVRYKAIVEKVNMSFSECIDDKEFWKDLEKYEQSKSVKHARLRLLNQADKEELSYQKLLENGLNGPVQGAVKLNDDLTNLSIYIEKYLTGDNTGVIKGGSVGKFDRTPRNVIYFGAPGTGKSYNLNLDKEGLISSEDGYERVTFHPDYSYANFVGTYKPVPKDDSKSYKVVPLLDDDSKSYKVVKVPNPDSISYEYVPGPFMRSLVKALKNPEKPFLLIIEEINRANVAAVFGDVFQLLDRDKDKGYSSTYPIETSDDMRKYLKKELDQDFEKIEIPSNMFIWATMNSADQGVFPMDTAFKRRWEFKYFGINDGDGKITNVKLKIKGQEISWNKLREKINEELLSNRINEDKLLGPFFAFNEYLEKELTDDDFKEINKIFKNKILMYLFEDAAKSKRDKLFSGVSENNKNLTFSRLRDEFDKRGLGIFCDSIKDEFSSENGTSGETDDESIGESVPGGEDVRETSSDNEDIGESVAAGEGIGESVPDNEQ